jgi:hypothetical protein
MDLAFPFAEQLDRAGLDILSLASDTRVVEGCLWKNINNESIYIVTFLLRTLYKT